MEFRKSETYQNLKKALFEELEKSAKYQIYADIARMDGYRHIGGVFEELSRDELMHAVLWFTWMNEGSMPETLTNIKEACDREKYLWTKAYKDYSDAAREEGFEEIATAFEEVGKIERNHDFKLEKIAENIEKNHVFCKEGKVIWHCMQCGYILFSTCAPDICPVCSAEQGDFEMYCADYLR